MLYLLCANLKPLHARTHRRSGLRTRMLYKENLESRLALTGSVMTNLPADDGSLSLYLAETGQMGPVAPGAEDSLVNETPAEDSQPVDASAADVLYADMAGEGESVAPTILDMTCTRGDGWITVSGHITDDDLMNSYVMVDGVVFWAESVGVSATGYFAISRADEGWDGQIFATAYDWDGNHSETVTCLLI